MALHAALTIFPRRDFSSSSWVDLATRWPAGSLPASEMSGASQSRSIRSEDRAARFGPALLEDSIHAVRRVRVRGNKSVIESAFSPPRPLMVTRPCLVLHVTGVTRSFSIPFFPRPPPPSSPSSSSSGKIQPGSDSGVGNDIDIDGNKAGDLWWRFIAVFIEVPLDPSTLQSAVYSVT